MVGARGANQYAASSLRIWRSVFEATVPWPFVLLFTVVSCMTTTLPSFVTPMSSSSMSAPARRTLRNAYSVFEGNSSSPPWCAMLSGRVFWIHGFAACAEATGTATAMARRSGPGERGARRAA